MKRPTQLLVMISYLSIMVSLSAQSQSNSRPSDETALLREFAQEQIVLAEQLDAPSEIEKAKGILQMALDQVEDQIGKEDTLAARLHREIGWVYFNQGNLSRAEIHFQTALNIRKKNFGEYHAKVADSYRDLAEIHYTQGNTAETEKYDTLVLHIRKRVLSDDDPALAQSYFDVANSMAGLATLRDALQSALKGLAIYQRAYGDHHMETSNSFMQVGSIYGRLGVYDKAIAYNQQALGIRRLLQGEVHTMVGRSYYETGGIYEDKGDLETALDYYKKSLRIFEQTLSPYYPERGRANYHVGSMYTELRQFEKAKPYLETALEIAKKAGGRSTYLANSHYCLGRWEELQGHYAAAIAHFQASHDTWQSMGRQYFMGLRKVQIGKLQQQGGQRAAALASLDAAANHLRLDSLEKLAFDQLKSPLAYQELLTQYAEYYYQSYQESGNKSDLQKSLDYDERNIALFETICEHKKSGYNRSFASHHFSKALASITDHYYAAYEQSGKVLYLKRAFENIEKLKGAILLDYLNAQDILQDSDIPPSALEQERLARHTIDSLEKRLYVAEQGDSQRGGIDQMYKDVFTAKESYYKLITELESQYPGYDQLKHTRKNNSFVDIRAGLSGQETSIIEYYLGREHLYIFHLRGEQFEVQRIVKPEGLAVAIDQLRKSTYTYHLSSSRDAAQQRKEIDQMISRSHELYQSLMAPIIDQFELAEQLIIIPDGVLGYLPFELLLTELPNDNFLFGQHAYLLKDYEISYAYSAALLLEMQERRHGISPQQFLAFAPSFESADASRGVEQSRAGLGALKYNALEVEALQKMMQGEIYTGVHATRDNFYEQAPNYQIIHLATHGKANDRVGDYAYLAFTQTADSLESSLVYNRELYNLKLNADLVVLSACETGIGELQQGEGIISLARGFSYAGAKSIITTLWSVDDQKTKDLMESFYHYIKKGDRKSAALRKAKLDFIEQYSHDAHPFYWSPFVAMGDRAPVQLNKGHWWTWGGGLLLISLSLWVLKRRI